MIKSIKQVDKYHFEIEWESNEKMLFKLSSLQKECPCSKCQNLDPESVLETVMAKSLRSVGNYAIKIEFTSGCSRGVFPFELLKSLGRAI